MANVETLNIVRLVEESPLTRFGNNVDYQSRLVDKLRQKFSSDEEHLFLASFYSYLNYGPNDFVVELRKVWKWLGFSRIDHAKTLLVKEFQADKDYQITAPAVAGAVQNGGQNREDTFLTVRCFKKFCLKARTKKADEIHDYYLNLEESIQEVLEEESEILQSQLRVKDKKIEQMSRKRAFGKERGSFIYVYKQNPQQNIFKVGKTTDLTQRQSDFLRANYNGKIVYTKSTINNTLAEQVIHHILDKYRLINDREWFEAEFEVIKNVVDSSCSFLDSGNAVEKKRVINKPIQEPRKESVKEERSEFVENNPHNLDKFIEDCCIIKKGAFTIKKELLGRFKLWCRSNDAKIKEETRLYFEKHYNPSKHYFAEHNSTLAVYSNIELKKLTYELSGNKPIDDFVNNECIIGPTNRIDSKTINAKFSECYPEVAVEELTQVLGNQFFPSSVYLKNRSLNGYWGIQLKNTEVLGLKKSVKRKKQVKCIDDNGIVKHTFSSITDCGKFFNVHPSNISMDLKYGRLRQGFKLET